MEWFGSFKTRGRTNQVFHTAVERPEQNTITNQPLPACSIQTAPSPGKSRDEKLMVPFLTVLFQIKYPRDQNFPLKSQVMDMLQKTQSQQSRKQHFLEEKPQSCGFPGCWGRAGSTYGLVDVEAGGHPPHDGRVQVLGPVGGSHHNHLCDTNRHH